ncbi:MAG: ANTAR domain-containing protein [Alphaproteobacteria bacterium]|nr:ANTAR domain-containing protein [Alphaproteobacteria bacterium]
MSTNLKVLLANSDPQRAAAVERSLGDRGNVLIVRVPEAWSIHDAVAAMTPDVVIVDMAHPDRSALDDLRRLSAVNPRPIVLFVERDDRAFMEEAIAAGVCSYNVVDAAFPDVKPIVMAAVAIFRKYRQIEVELARASTSLRERQAIDRAKALLMKQRNVGEPEAYRWLRRRAMNENKRIAAVAVELIANEENGDAKP